MNRVLVDTDVVSYAFRDDERYEFYRDHLSGKQAFISFMTWAELLRGTLSANWGDQRQGRLLNFVREHFVVIETNRTICRHWASLTDQAIRKGRVLHCADGWVAATACAAGLPLLSHNGRDFSYLEGLVVITNA